MGRGSEAPRRHIVFVKLVARNDKKETDPHFILTEKKDGAVVHTREQALSGNFLRMGTGSYVYEGITQHTLQIWLFDKEEEFKIEMNIDSNLGRNLANRMLKQEEFGWMELRVYSKKTDDGKVLPNLYVGNDNEPLSWKYSYSDVLKPLVKTFFNPKTKKDDTDYTAVNEKLLNELIPHAKVVNAIAAKKNPAAAATASEGNNPNPDADLGALADTKGYDVATGKSSAPGPADASFYNPPPHTAADLPIDADELPF